MNESTILKAAQARLWAEYRTASRAMSALPGVSSGAMGLTPDSVKRSPEYQRLRLARDSAFAALRRFNRQHAKALRKVAAIPP